jgi:AcrR family transcriptional regulator
MPPKYKTERSPGARKTSSKPPKHKKTYHHGDLRDALLAAAERTLRNKGLASLTLRAIAREAGVSHGAPAHHFPDLSTLLSELAAVGFNRFADYLETGLAQPGNPRRNSDHSYLRFALEHRPLFLLMFRDERLDSRNPALQAGRTRALGVLAKVQPRSPSTPLQRAGAMASSWCLVHGFSILAVENRLARLLEIAPGIDLHELLDAALDDIGRLPAKT